MGFFSGWIWGANLGKKGLIFLGKKRIDFWGKIGSIVWEILFRFFWVYYGKNLFEFSGFILGNFGSIFLGKIGSNLLGLLCGIWVGSILGLKWIDGFINFVFSRNLGFNYFDFWEFFCLIFLILGFLVEFLCRSMMKDDDEAWWRMRMKDDDEAWWTNGSVYSAFQWSVSAETWAWVNAYW